VAGRACTIEKRGRQSGDARDTLADLTKARKLLAYEPRVGLEEGLKAEWDWIVSDSLREAR
jgi:UDP-glucose 4-epimerase